MPKARANKTSFNIMIVYFNIRRKRDIIRYKDIQCGWEPVLIQRIIIGFEAILEMSYQNIEGGIESRNFLVLSQLLHVQQAMEPFSVIVHW